MLTTLVMVVPVLIAATISLLQGLYLLRKLPDEGEVREANWDNALQ